MKNKKIILLIGVLCVLAGAIGIFLIEHEQTQQKTETNKQTEVKPKKSANVEKAKDEKTSSVKKADLYSNSVFDIPLVSIAETVTLSPETKQKIDNILQVSNGCYLLKQNPENKEICIILQSPVKENENCYPRHNLQVVNIDTNGHATYSNIGYSGQENEIDNAVLKTKTDEWVFDETSEPYRPLSHTVYDKKKKVVMSETWNYDDSDPVKYEMKNSDGHVLSVMKETVSGDSEYRQEHIFYDSEGHTKRSFVASYDGADIKWFTYYDAEAPYKNITIESQYDNGLKTAEKIYNQDYQLVNTIKADYTDGERSGLKVLDAEGNEISAYENE